MTDTTYDQLHAFWLRIWSVLRLFLDRFDGDKFRQVVNNPEHPFWSALHSLFMTLTPRVRGVLLDVKTITIDLKRMSADGCFEKSGLFYSTHHGLSNISDCSTLPLRRRYCFSKLEHSAELDDLFMSTSSSTTTAPILNSSEIYSVLTYMQHQAKVKGAWPLQMTDFFCFVRLQSSRIAIVSFHLSVPQTNYPTFAATLWKSDENVALEDVLQCLLANCYFRSVGRPVLLTPDEGVLN